MSALQVLSLLAALRHLQHFHGEVLAPQGKCGAQGSGSIPAVTRRAGLWDACRDLPSSLLLM